MTSSITNTDILYHSIRIWYENKINGYFCVCVFFYSRLNSRLYVSLLMYHFIKHLNHFIYCRKSFKKCQIELKQKKIWNWIVKFPAIRHFYWEYPTPEIILFFAKGQEETIDPTKKIFLIPEKFSSFFHALLSESTSHVLLFQLIEPWILSSNDVCRNRPSILVKMSHCKLQSNIFINKIWLSTGNTFR